MMQASLDQPSSALELRCPRCGLMLPAGARRLLMEYCPRCIARARKLITLQRHALQAYAPTSSPPRLVLRSTRDATAAGAAPTAPEPAHAQQR